MTTIAHVPKEILISSDLSELRVAVLEEGRASEAYVERRGEGSIAGNIYKAKVDNVLRGMEAAFIELGLPKNGFLHVDDVMLPGMDTSSRRKKKIDELLKPGQEVLVQVVKNPMGTKGARVTMELSIAGRFLVLTPGGEGAGVSKRLPDAERERLRKLVKQLELDDEGVIARTAAEGATMEDLERDLRFLRKIWAQIETRAKTAKGSSLVFREADLSLRVIRDVLSRNVEEVLVDSERQYRRILGFVRTTQPELAERIKLYSGAKPMFERYGVEAAIRSTLNRRVDLPSGGYLIFDYAEAFTVIDVNTGRYVGKTGRLEDTITKNNIEAAREVMRQLRLRDIGGIIVIDFIDMEKAKNRAEVLSVLQAELGKDRTKTYLVEISPLGLVEMTRQNVTEGVRELLTSTCPTCGGEGRVLSVDTMGVEAERKLRKLARSAASEAMLVKMNAKVASRLVGPGGERLIELERELGKWFTIEADGRIPLEELDVLKEGTRAEIDGTPPVKEGEEVRLKIAEPHQFNLSDGVARVGGYPVVVGGGISYVGQEHKVRIERAGRTTAYATLLDAKPKALEIPQDPAEFEIPEFDREIGERLELEDRSRNRRGRTARTPKKAAEAKPAASRSRAKPAAGEAEVEPAEVDAVAEAPAEGDEAAAAKPKRRRGTRGGRGRTKKPATAATSANGDEPQAAAEPEATEDKPAPKPRRRRAPAKPQPDAEAPAAAEVPASPNGDEPEAKPKPRRRTRTTKPKEEPAAAVEASAPPAEEPKRAGGLFSRLLGE
ncbi:MAG: Rne/Rng family ribonuclease [Gaiellales bacterium]|jgi:ribonuclease G